MARTQGVGGISKELAVNAGVTGPMLRACGVNYDLRKVDKYGIYDRFQFRVPLGEHGDVYDRYMIRVLEMRESLKILEQAMRDLPRRADHRSKDQGARLPPQAGRGGMGGSRRRRVSSGFYPHQRWVAQPVSVPGTAPEPHQPHGARGHVRRTECGGCGDHSGERRHRDGRGRPLGKRLLTRPALDAGQECCRVD